MGRKKKEDSDGQLTPLELEIMSTLWKIGEGSVHDVIEALPKDRDYAYTTVSTVLRILLSKEVVKAEASGRQHTYVPLLSKQKYESMTLKHVVTTVFGGDSTSLLKRLIDDRAISKSELDEIKKMIEQGGKK